MQQAAEMLPRFIRQAIPVALALGALLWSYMCYTVARMVLRRVGHPLPAVPPILTWRLSGAIASIMLWAGVVASLAAIRAPNLAGLALDEGMSGFVLMADDALTVERFAAEVAPSVRELVARERASTAGSPSADFERTVVSPNPSTTPVPGAPAAAAPVAPPGRPAARRACPASPRSRAS